MIQYALSPRSSVLRSADDCIVPYVECLVKHTLFSFHGPSISDLMFSWNHWPCSPRQSHASIGTSSPLTPSSLNGLVIDAGRGRWSNNDIHVPSQANVIPKQLPNPDKTSRQLIQTPVYRHDPDDRVQQGTSKP
ncbi:hypothetical protein QCA50_003339 [Cerrena zonata]|uniref:Uncharacterized protein n=1 Tax=Cerrena zonata TaxID=2478898 RepID=A0AAW0GPE2_9APHY